MLNSKHLLMLLVSSILTLEACCDSEHEVCRRKLVELQECDESGICEARWAGTEAWSRVFPTNDVESMAPAEPPWDCDPEPDVDLCVRSSMGVVGCFRIESAYAVPVAPSCAPGTDGPEWIDVGNGMVAHTHPLTAA